MSNTTIPQTSTTTNVQPLTNHPCNPYYSGNSAAASNMGPAVNPVNPVNGSGMGGGGGPGGGHGGGGGAGGHGGPGAAQFNIQRAVDIPVIGGGIDRLGRPWTGGILDPGAHDYHLRANAKPRSVSSLRSQEMEIKNHKSISSGVENCTKLTPKSNLLLSSKTIWKGIVENGYDSYFYVQDAQGTWINLYLQPDALSTTYTNSQKC